MKRTVVFLFIAAQTWAVEDGATHEKRSEDGIAAAIALRDNQYWQSSREQRQQRRTEWMEKLGLDMVLSYDSLVLGALADDQNWGSSSGDATLNVRWRVNPHTSKAPLSLNLRMRHRHAYSDLAPSELRAETGAHWGHVDGFTDAGFQVPELFFEDRLFDERLTLRYGQMSIDDLLDGHELRSAKRSFMNQAFSSSPAVGFPGSDLGFITRWQSRHHWELTLALSNLTGSNLRETTHWKLDGRALFQGLQVAYDFAGIGNHAARVQLLLWRSDSLPEQDLSSGRGLSFTCEQEISKQTRAFLKYAWSDGMAATTEHFAAAGLARDFSPVDRVGIALATGRSSQDKDEWQGVLELTAPCSSLPTYNSPLATLLAKGVSGC
jgi:porin